ncbi:Mucin-associated surface protein (MASP) subgroup S089 [Trypanosoma cruzi]|uniref:Mucin-associated surface protein (MASP) subgroup S089 n=1 Tax=Trypanosoma cruzi TaxID=5693 RepID=A0A7J6YD14_TRYCR|nr:Mucin-associated surface protein (MASP) subgroup S089 [Trypanosoma cruzi]
MAMMMAGRVLLVCALCVLWCGACGVYARDRDNSAVGGCMASGVLDTRRLYMPRRCNKTAVTLPLRHVFPISAVGASTDGQVSGKIDGGLFPIPAPALPPAPNTPKAPEAPTSHGVSQPAVGVHSGDGTPSLHIPNVDSSVGGGSGQSGNSNGTVVSVMEPPSTVVVISPSSVSPEVDGLQNKDGPPSNLKLGSPAISVESGKILVGHNGETEKDSTPDDGPESSRIQEETESRATTEEARGSEAGQSGVGTNGPSNVLSTESQQQNRETTVTETKPPPPSPGKQIPAVSLPPGVDAPAALSQGPQASSPEPSRAAEDPEEEKRILPATTASHNSKGETHKASSLRTETVSAAPKPPSPDVVLEQNSEGTVTKDAMKTDAYTDGPAATSESSISTSDSGVVQDKTEEEDDNEQRREAKGPHNDPHAGNTNDAPTASVTAAETVKTITTQTNTTSKSGDSDGSTTASHTTSPLLLLLLVVVACAAAAAVVAA